MEILKLIGVVIVIIGFAIKFDTIATVVIAGLATGLVAGMTPMEIFDTLGKSFISNRTATLFVLTLPVIGVCERYGLKEKAIDFIRSIKNATTGRVILIYQRFVRSPLHSPFVWAATRSLFAPLSCRWRKALPPNTAKSPPRYPMSFAARVPQRRTTATSMHRTASWARPARC